jgi:D-glycero-alpha-D-manno-heptose-7-phosphate kinase
VNGLKRGKKLNFDINNYVVDRSASIEDALTKIQENTHGMVCITGEHEEVIGIATDGDIRLGLLAGLTLKDPISDCFNKDFVWSYKKESRINLIKKLDAGIRYIPILDDKKKLLFIASSQFIPLKDEKEIYVRAKAPVRISFGGGGSDLTHYFLENEGAVINSAISLFSHATMRPSRNSNIKISSLDLGEMLSAKNINDAILKGKDGSFSLVLSLLEVIKPKYGFELYLHSDFPVGSGLGGSATLSAAVLGCFNQLRVDKWDQHELAEIAFQAERLNLGIAGGWQDQYAAVFGGINFLEFGAHANVISPLRVNKNTLLELEESLILCDTAIPHHSGDIHIDQKKTMSSKVIKDNVKENVQLTYDIRNHLLSGNLDNFGISLDKAWQLKKTFSSKISNKYIDDIYEGALKNGALGGKLLGAGGGGFFMFYSPPFEKHNLIKFLESKKLKVQPFRFEENGLQTWTSRINDRNKSEGSK